MSYYNFDPYMSVEEKSRRAAKEVERLRKAGRAVNPITIVGRKLAETFWGQAWCTHLDSFADYENRLPRGRSYVRNGAVCHLEIEDGCVRALVSGTKLYKVNIEVCPLPHAHWEAIKSGCRGQIRDILDLLRGKLPKEVISRLCEVKNGLFPGAKEIRFSCSCPDWASMCKHVAAVLYAVGRRLDAEPELLFQLRQVDAAELLTPEAALNAVLPSQETSGEDTLQTDDLGALFGIELDMGDVQTPQKAAVVAPSPKRGRPRTSEKTTKHKPTGGSEKSVQAESAHDLSILSALPDIAQFTGADVASLRACSGLSPYAFASALGVTEATLTRWEKSESPLRLWETSRKKLQKLRNKMERRHQKLAARTR